MAGDWIAMRTDLADDPAVIQIADALGLDEFGVIGRLHRLWAWADQQTTDGVVTLLSRTERDKSHAPGVTDALHGRDAGVIFGWIDRYVGAPGFASAMLAAGWLDEADGVVRFPNFDRWNTQTAKKRLLAAKRQSRRRASDGTFRHASVTPPSRSERDTSVTRGEERRGEEEKKSAAPPPRRRPAEDRRNEEQPGERPEDVPIPPALRSVEFLAAWRAWVEFRRKARFTAKADYLREKLADLEPLGPARAARCLEHSRSNRYQGLFPEKFAGRQAGPAGKQDLIERDLADIKEGLLNG